jgi:hypothetical protein
MKRLLLVLAGSLTFCSCENTWDSEARDLFHQGCMESARESHMEEAAAKSMCDCRLEKAMKKHPNFADAMRHAGDMMNDPEMKACK